jgi:hypothetical protein
MDVVYNLVMVRQENSGGNPPEEFNIGFFSSHEKAQDTARRYQTQVKGFSRCLPCIETKPLIGHLESRALRFVYILYGWNETPEGGEEDMVESDCFAEQPLAEREMEVIQQTLKRDKWCMECYQLDQCHWENGVVGEE